MVWLGRVWWSLGTRIPMARTLPSLSIGLLRAVGLPRVLSQACSDAKGLFACADQARGGRLHLWSPRRVVIRESRAVSCHVIFATRRVPPMPEREFRCRRSACQ